jgi:CIC family chloride channel protein
MRQRAAQLAGWLMKRNRPWLLFEAAPLDLRIVGRMVLHAALVGVAAGLAGAAFFGALEAVQRLLLEGLAGYVPLRANGEMLAAPAAAHEFRPWVLLFLPALGGLACGLVTLLAPEARGGGGDAMIEAFHQKGGVIRGRVVWVKMLASIFTLGTGGAGGREGPTMQIGGALGSLVARVLNVSARERRILMVAGVAAGISAVFRTPLGAALLAVEVLYRDGFESDALIPSVLSSVVAYSVVISIFGESTLLAHPGHFVFVPAQLPLFALLAFLVAGMALLFLWVYRATRRFSAWLPVPGWLKPALGGLALGAMVTPLVVYSGSRLHGEGQGLGILGGGYGAVQMAISGAAWLPGGWAAVLLLVGLAFAKLVGAAFTIGSGGSAGDFAPSLAIGGLVGGAFGRAAQAVLQDPRIDPGAFALVGMAAFYGGIAHVPLSALVLACELAGNYDLLVPLMLAQGVAFVALRKHSLYGAQMATQAESPVHRDALVLEVLQATQVKSLMTHGRPYVCFGRPTPGAEMLQHVADATWQDVFPVVDEAGKMVGLVTAAALQALAGQDLAWAVADDVMQKVVAVRDDDTLRTAAEQLLSNGLREVPVLDAAGKVVGFLDESSIAALYLKAAVRAEKAQASAAPPAG